ncbi:phthiocerol/phthiodiolone dimycocerosyl transferase family protein [Streptomyces hoynatensis]|uniref:Phthiocerol/phthiodiolone dimycocerosyl transferase n=1 Tax=Streptomyces hoynatensis TaxID=1141874 RepID=A0A3A9ZCC5_9ACTN|nr:condensation protein [Streptomyces hoynatensis]RKN45883.1 condensation protein [Streptomyces hoynatensis]
MSAAPLERALSPHEAAMLAGDMRVVTVWELRGEVAEDALETALGHLARRYPVLGGRLFARGGEGVLRIDPTPVPLRLHRGGDLARAIGERGDWATGPLLRTTLVTGPAERGRHLVAAFPRACVDGMCVVAVQQEFLALYAAARAGKDPDLTPVLPVLAGPLEAELEGRCAPGELRAYAERRAAEEAERPPARLAPAAAVDGGPGPDPGFGTARAELSPAETAALTGLAHRAGLTVNTLVCGLLLAALRPSLEPADGALPVSCGVAVDLRRRLSPPVPNEVIQSAASGFPVRLDVARGSDPLSLAHRLAGPIRAHLRAGTAEREVAAFPHLTAQGPASLFVTNLGEIDSPSLPEPARAARLQVLPLTRMPMVFAVVTRYRGSLHVDFPFSRAWYTDGQIRRLAAATRSLAAELSAR